MSNDAYALIEATLEFFTEHPEAFCRDTLARSKESKQYPRGKPQAPGLPRAVMWSLPGYMMKRSQDFSFSYDEALAILAKAIKEDYGTYDSLSDFRTVNLLNDALGYKTVINFLNRIVSKNGNSNSANE